MLNDVIRQPEIFGLDLPFWLLRHKQEEIQKGFEMKKYIKTICICVFTTSLFASEGLLILNIDAADVEAVRITARFGQANAVHIHLERKADINQLVQFLNGSQFIRSKTPVPLDLDKCPFHIQLVGIHDQLYVFESHALIGKSQFTNQEGFTESLERFLKLLED